MGFSQAKSHKDWSWDQKIDAWSYIMGEGWKPSGRLWGITHSSSHYWFQSCPDNAICLWVDSSDKGNLNRVGARD